MCSAIVDDEDNLIIEKKVLIMLRSQQYILYKCDMSDLLSVMIAITMRIEHVLQPPKHHCFVKPRALLVRVFDWSLFFPILLRKAIEAARFFGRTNNS